MLEEKNDNLQNADGNSENVTNKELQSTSESTEKIDTTQTTPEQIEQAVPEEVTNNTVEANEVAPEIIEKETIITDENKKALEEIENSNAEESEDETLSERHEIPMLEYDTMSTDALVSELQKLLESGKVASIREHVEEIRKEFLAKYSELFDQAKEKFASENDGETLDFEFHFPLKQKFDALYEEYKDRRNKHYTALENNLKANLNKRLEIIEELKNLVNPETNIPDLFKQFNEIRDRWRTAGPIPKDKYNHVWNNYHFHVENFYDYIHLDREARDMDFKHNLEQKQKVIARAKELLEESDMNKVFRELQLLHKLWKEELGPVAREHREEIWNEFSAVTKQIHDKRENYYQELRSKEEENLTRKAEVIAKIAQATQEEISSHSQWQKQIQKIDALREEFFAIGRVPLEKRDEIWEEFKNITKEFNLKKNAFYRNIKNEQQENLSKKQILLNKAIELKDSEDFDKVTPIMKQIQEDWKAIGHVPRKVSDEIWKQFKEACNHYFNRLHAKRNQENSVELEAYEKKKEYLDTLKNVELSGEHKADLELIKSHIETWKSFGRVPYNKRHIEAKYNKVLDILFDKLSMSKRESESLRYSSRISNLVEADDTRKLNSERIFLSRKIDEIKSDIRQLENNIMFITGAKDNNPLVIEVNKNIERQKQELQTWKDKLIQLNQAIRKSQNQEEQKDSDQNTDKENEA